MRSIVEVSIFAAMKIPHARAETFSKPFHESLEVAHINGAIRGQVIVVICEGQETVVFVEGGFVHAAERPLPGALKPASDALSTGHLDRRQSRMTKPAVEHKRALPGGTGLFGPVTFERVIAGHLVYRRMPPRFVMPGAAEATFRRLVLEAVLVNSFRERFLLIFLRL